MIVLLGLAFIIIPWLYGKSVCTIFYGRRKEVDFFWGDYLLTGWMIFIGLAEASHLGTMFLRRSFSDCVFLFEALNLSVLFLCCLFLFARWIFHRGQKEKKPVFDRQAFGEVRLIWIGTGLLMFTMLLMLWLGDYGYSKGDVTPETVATFLHTDQIHAVNPLTGMPYTQGIPMRLQILCLPSFYGCLCRIFGLTTELVVNRMIPTAVMFLAFLAYYSLAGALFPKDHRKKAIFLLTVAILFGLGTYFDNMDGFGLFYAGYRGLTIRNTVLLPILLSSFFRERRILMLLCVITEACMVWTLYGAGLCLLVGIGLYLTYWVLWYLYPVLRKKEGNES